MTGGEGVVASLRAHGVDTVFGIPGVHTLNLYDAIRREPGLRHVLARHEQGAGFMAEGYARASGRIGVACTISGPGVTNVATAMASAYADSVPLLVISSALRRGAGARRRGELHELRDQLGVMEAVAGWTRRLEAVGEIPGALDDAFGALTAARPRGAYVEIPFDLLGEVADFEIEPPPPARAIAPDAGAIAAAVAILQRAARPLIVAGNGVTAAGANGPLMALAEQLGAPVLLGSKSHDVMPTTHPLTLATTWTLPAALLDFVRDRDAVLVVGSKLGAERTDYGALPFTANLIHVDIDPAEIGREYPAAVAITADARLAIEGLLTALQGWSPGAEGGSAAVEIRAVRESLSRHTRTFFGDSVDLLGAIREALPRNGRVVADMTMLGYAAAQCFEVDQPRTFLESAELGTIGAGLPMALGAKVADPFRPVVALCGDGGLLLNLGELAAAFQEGIHVVLVVFNDSAYTAVKMSQRDDFDRQYIATDLVAPDFVTLAQAFGAAGVRVRTPKELRTAVAAAIADGARTTLIEVPLPPGSW